MEKEQEKVQKTINLLADIIYELYEEYIKGGKLKVGMSRVKKQSVGKSAQKTKTFQQTSLVFKEKL